MKLNLSHYLNRKRPAHPALDKGWPCSAARFIHLYYLTEMAPAAAALFGIGIVTMWRDYRQAGWRGWLLPLALIATALEQIHILSNYLAWALWLIPPMAGLCTLGVGVLFLSRFVTRDSIGALSTRSVFTALAPGILAVLIAPTVWAAIPVMQDTTASLPAAGPTRQGSFGSADSASADPALISYLEKHQGIATYLVATASTNTADEIILATNKPVMALGGFTGSDPILTTITLASLVAKGTVRFFLLNSFGSGSQPPLSPGKTARNPGEGFSGSTQSSLTAWVTQHCAAVSTSLWQSASSSTGGFVLSDANQLYDCTTRH